MRNIFSAFAAAVVFSFFLSPAARADVPTDLACPPGDISCRAFVGTMPEAGPFLPMADDQTKKIYRVGDGFVALTDHEAWREMRCLAYVAWAEARDDGRDGMKAVMWVVANRVNHPSFPKTICGVVAQKSQFEALRRNSGPAVRQAAQNDTMVPDLTAKNDAEQSLARLAKALAWAMLKGELVKDITLGATHFLAPQLVKARGHSLPVWARRFSKTIVLNGHHFYKMPAA